MKCGHKLGSLKKILWENRPHFYHFQYYYKWYWY